MKHVAEWSKWWLWLLLKEGEEEEEEGQLYLDLLGAVRGDGPLVDAGVSGEGDEVVRDLLLQLGPVLMEQGRGNKVSHVSRGKRVNHDRQQGQS